MLPALNSSNITRTRPRIFILFCLIGDFLAFTCTAVTIVGSYLTFNTYGFDADGETITQSQPVVLMHLQLLQPWAVSVNVRLTCIQNFKPLIDTCCFSFY